MIDNMEKIEDRIISRRQASIAIGVSEVWISKLCDRLGLSKVAGAYLIRESDIERLSSLRLPVGRPTEK